MKPIAFGIIGCEHGHIGIFIEEMLALGHACVGIYEPRNVGLASSMAEQYGVPLVGDLDRLMAEDVKVIGCAAINNEKIDVIERCERYGKHVMVDKPAVTNRTGYERLKAVADRGEIQVGMLLTERFQPAIHTLKKLIDQGELGRLISIGMRKPHLLRKENRPPWFFSKERNGGIVIDLLVHDFDLLRWLTGGDILHIEGIVSKHGLPEHPDFYDAASLQVIMNNGIIAQLYADWHTPERSWTWGDGRIFVTGTDDVAELRLSGDPFMPSGDGSLLLRATHAKSRVQTTLDIPLTVTEDFMRRIEGNVSLLTSEDILLAAKATIEADESVRFISYPLRG
ncbi:gfo/Idh/MocA family oxidoreductase [Cohnella endophytica]|uniref:Gfo/Idh/MocA family oxidoreductase n=1 Tax=Cohnella endophytica TaxID=2419778 RepID=A0A494XL19_9BACL|nr:Gfo/Idh/MocA family oxidoreductase [Cohnella endophytica]RKP51407.1 gfo/Idh/MocA family oxidoreductase [Cohnella endophytica]